MKMYESSTFETDTESGFSDALEAPQTDMLKQKRLTQILNSKHKIDQRLRQFVGIWIKEEHSCNSGRKELEELEEDSAEEIDDFRMNSMMQQKD